MELKKKKIAVLCNYELLPNRLGGMDYFFWSFDEKCKANGFEIDWYFPNESRHGQYQQFIIFSSNYASLENFFLNQNTNSYNYIFTHFIELCTPFFYKLKQLSGAKVIAVDHNPRPLNGYSFKKKIEKRVKGVLYSKYIDVFVSVSGDSKNHLIKDFGKQLSNKIKIIHNGLLLDKFIKKQNFETSKRFIVVSHLRKEKGIQDLISALKDVKSFDFIIDIYGNGYYEAVLKKMIHDFSVEKFFNFKGNVNNLNEIYCQYDYLIHPSHGETFCYSVVESLMSNLPVITTCQAGNVLGLVKNNHNGYLYTVADTDALKNILLLVLKNENKITSFFDNEMELKNYSLEEMTQNYYDLLS